MRRLRPSFLAAALCVAGGAHAQAVTPVQEPQSAVQAPAPPLAQPPAQQPQPQPQTAQRGFFPPTPGDDPSLFHTLPPEAYTPPSAVQQPAQANARPAPATPPLVVVVPDPEAQSRLQLERAQIEAQQATARMRQAPAPINGAFTGATDEADRR